MQGVDLQLLLGSKVIKGSAIDSLLNGELSPL